MRVPPFKPVRAASDPLIILQYLLLLLTALLSHQITFIPPLHFIMMFIPLWTTLSLLITTILPASATPATPINLITPLYNATTPPIVNLDYASYQGYYDSKFGLNVFKGYTATAIHLTQDT